jgi:hypothetical protein
MRRVEYLINEIRQSTDNVDTNGIPDREIVSYLNYAQKLITPLIFKANPYADIFKGVDVQASNSTGVYDLPTDIYSVNAISMVEGRYAATEINDGYVRIKPISESELSYMFGYVIRNNQVLISGQNNTAQLTSLRITYFRNLPTMGIRQAKVLSVTANTSIQLASDPVDLYLIDDHCTAVDALGDQVVPDIYFTNNSCSTLLTANTTGVLTSHYIVAGTNSCNRSELPDSCEPYLLDYVRQRIYTRNNYEDARKQNYFTELHINEITSIFSKNKKDDDVLPLTDIGFLNF